MEKPSKMIFHGFKKLRFSSIPPNPSIRSSISGFSTSRNLSSALSPNPTSNELLSKPTSIHGLLSRLLSRSFSSRTPQISTRSFTFSNGISPYGFSISSHSLGLPSLASRTTNNGLRYRLFSAKGLNSAKIEGGSTATKSIIGKPLFAVKSAVSHYRGAAGLQMEAFWKRNYLVVVGAVAVVLCVALWRIMFGIASTFVGLSEGMAKYGFLALAASMVAFAGIYVRSRITINPDKIYRIAMRKLNTSAGILEVMGAPLAGTEVRAYVMSGGGPQLKNFKLRFGGKRCFLIFPIRGSERKGLVSVEAKKKKGQYDIKLLAVDIPMTTGPDHRVFLVGDEEEYEVGGGLISELRDPIVKAMAAEKEFEDLDQKEEEEDAKRELEEEERKQREDEERALEEEERKRSA